MGRGWVSFGSWIFIFHVLFVTWVPQPRIFFGIYNCDFIMYIRRCLQIIYIGVSKIHSLYMYLLCVYVCLLLLCVSE